MEVKDLYEFVKMHAHESRHRLERIESKQDHFSRQLESLQAFRWKTIGLVSGAVVSIELLFEFINRL